VIGSLQILKLVFQASASRCAGHARPGYRLSVVRTTPDRSWGRRIVMLCMSMNTKCCCTNSVCLAALCTQFWRNFHWALISATLRQMVFNSFPKFWSIHFHVNSNKSDATQHELTRPEFPFSVSLCTFPTGATNLGFDISFSLLFVSSTLIQKRVVLQFKCFVHVSLRIVLTNFLHFFPTMWCWDPHFFISCSQCRSSVMHQINDFVLDCWCTSCWDGLHG